MGIHACVQVYDYVSSSNMLFKSVNSPDTRFSFPLKITLSPSLTTSSCLFGRYILSNPYEVSWMPLCSYLHRSVCVFQSLVKIMYRILIQFSASNTMEVRWISQTFSNSETFLKCFQDHFLCQEYQDPNLFLYFTSRLPLDTPKSDCIHSKSRFFSVSSAISRKRRGYGYSVTIFPWFG